MDSVTIGSVLLSIFGGVGGKLGEQLLAGMSALVRWPFHCPAVEEGPSSALMSSGQAELTALKQAPDDRERAVALAEVLVRRAGSDSAFQLALEGWWQQAAPIRAGVGNVTNVISGGDQHGPVLMGRDFTSLTFGIGPASDPNP